MLAKSSILFVLLPAILAAANPLGSEEHIAAREALSGCDQGSCPDHDRTVDLMTWGFSSPYWVRVNDCGQCKSISTSSDGCVDFNMCGKNQNICIDRGRARGHRINKDTGSRECFTVDYTDQGTPVCGTVPGGFPAVLYIWAKKDDVPCTW